MFSRTQICFPSSIEYQKISKPQPPLGLLQNVQTICLMMMSCFCAMADQRQAFSLISSWHHIVCTSPPLPPIYASGLNSYQDFKKEGVA